MQNASARLVRTTTTSINEECALAALESIAKKESSACIDNITLPASAAPRGSAVASAIPNMILPSTLHALQHTGCAAARPLGATVTLEGLDTLIAGLKRARDEAEAEDSRPAAMPRCM